MSLMICIGQVLTHRTRAFEEIGVPQNVRVCSRLGLKHARGVSTSKISLKFSPNLSFQYQLER